MWYIHIMNNRGQNTVEYLLLVVAIMAVMIAFMSPSGTYQNGLENAMNQATVGAINKINTEIKF